jgi:uncharacterized protein DUF4190/uncharacterized protein DUF4339
MTGAMWFWRHDGHQGGPVDWDGLMALARAGNLRSSDPVLRQGTDQWVRADQARGEGPPGIPQAPVAAPGYAVAPGYTVAPPGYGAPAPMPYPSGAPVPPPSMYAGPTSGALAAMGPPRFAQMPSAENGFDGNGYGAGYAQGSGESHQGTAVTSFVLALVGLFIFGWACGAGAIGTGLKALNGMKASGNTSGRGLAIAGIVIGVLDIIGVMFYLATRHTHRGH